MSDSPTSKLERAPASGWLTGELVWLGILLPAAVVILDQYLLASCLRSPRDDALAAFTFAVFVAQTGLLSRLVGARVKSRPHWWGIFAWSLLLVDLQVFSLAVTDDSWSNPVNAFGHAFGSAQIGLATCWGILGKMKFTTRIPLGMAGFALSWAFCVSMASRGNWMPVLFLQSLATMLVCLVMRWLRFTIDEDDQSGSGKTKRDKQKLQFSIRHLFYWTTGMAILIGVGRLIDFRGLVASSGWSGLTVYAPAFTMITVMAFWAALGSESWIVRFPVLLIGLPGIGLLLGWHEKWIQRVSGWRWRAYMMPWNASLEEMVTFWIVWATLAGMLLAAFVLVFRAGGQRLSRRA